MIDLKQFADKQLELAVEFARYIAEHPEIDDALPGKSRIYFQVEGEAEFNRYSRDLAERQRQEEGLPLVRVRIKGLAAKQGSRLIEPVVETGAAVA
ncbi:MAG TPA: DUF5647 family protein [Pirellulales bacterium]|nr:DUF5647 family protein [Pirellulales bacterium]